MLNNPKVLIFDDDAPPTETYPLLGSALARTAGIYRDPHYASGLMEASSSPLVPPRPIIKGSELAPVLVDRLRIQVVKGGKVTGSTIPIAKLGIMLQAVRIFTH